MNFFSFTFVWSVSICLIVATMQATGLGNPNCEPTTIGYVGFYTTLFGCSVIGCILGILCVGLITLAYRPKA